MTPIFYHPHSFFSEATFSLLGLCEECMFAICVVESKDHFGMCRMGFEQSSVCVDWL